MRRFKPNTRPFARVHLLTMKALIASTAAGHLLNLGKLDRADEYYLKANTLRRAAKRAETRTWRLIFKAIGDRLKSGHYTPTKGPNPWQR